MKRVDSKKANTTIDTFALAAAEILSPLAEKDENVAFILAKISDGQKALNTAIKRDKVYSGLDEADSARDAVLKKIDATLAGLAAIPVPEISAAAEKIGTVWKKYTLAIASEAYDRESSLIESFYADVAPLSADVKALPGFQILLDSLRAAEDDFKAKEAAYTKAQSGGAKSATAVKKDLVQFINSCALPYIEAMCFIKGDLFSPVASELESRITRTNS